MFFEEKKVRWIKNKISTKQTTKTEAKTENNMITEVKSLSPRYINYSSNSKRVGQGGKCGNSSIRKANDNSIMATMKYKDMFVVCPNAQTHVMKRKKEALKKDGNGYSKMVKSGSMSAMHCNQSISDSNSKKQMARQNTSSALNKVAYNVSHNTLSNMSTKESSIPTIAMFNSIINSHKNLKSVNRKKDRGDTISPNSYSKFRNTFLSIYDYSSPSTASGSKNSRAPTTSAALKKMLLEK